MINYIKRKIEKSQLKRTFKRIWIQNYKITLIDNLGTVEYAQWLHPFENPKVISLSNINFYQKLSNKGGMIIDIGAHTGDTTVPMALAVGKEGLVLGLEPNKYVYKILEQNASLNLDKSNIIPLCFAATDKDGEFTFNYSDASYCNGGFLSKINKKRHGHKFTLQVIGKNLQDYLLKNHSEDLKKLDLIKIDAEGYDKEILKTIPIILENHKPNLMIECYKRLDMEEREELFDLVNGFGYQLYFLENFELFDKLEKIEKSNMNDKKHFEMLAIHKSKNISL
ncbi:MAG: FkbM family methyltransferase [Bacteroidales bacterium]|nr:FkbM family methyltransferase [Bacteroidales bacterium]